MLARCGGRWLVVLVVGCNVALVASGCGRQGTVVDRAPIKPGSGYAYTAVLMATHPLYETLARLEMAAETLGEDQTPTALGLLGPALEPVTLTEAAVYSPDPAALQSWESWWREQYTGSLDRGEGLPRDLLAGLEWEREQARQQVDQSMLEAEAQLTRRLARLRARLVKEQQERLNNLELDLSSPESAVLEAAQAERQRIWDAIELRLALERERGEGDLAELRRRLEAEAGDRVAAARARAEERVQMRAEQMATAGVELHDEMGGEIGDLSWGTLAPQALSVGAEQANARLGEGEQSREAAEQARSAALQRQRMQLLVAEARLRNRLKSDTEIWATAVARRYDVQLQLIPGGRRDGRDMTGTIAVELRRVWGGERL